jgi:hypothetical protein
VAVLAVYGEKLSAFQFPDLRENTGNIRSSCTAPALLELSFPFQSTGKGQIP